MAIWIFEVTHQDQKIAHGERDFMGPGDGRIVIVRDLECSCGHKHTLIGTQHTGRRSSGLGHNSVEPPNDPGSKRTRNIDAVPSWDGSPVGP
jgi:hypothetical protein